MKECDNSKIHMQQLPIVCMSSNNVGHLITSTIIRLQHFATLHYTYRHVTSSRLHFTTLSFGLTHLHFLSFYFTSHH